MATTPKKIEEVKPDTAVVSEAKRHIRELAQLRAGAVEALKDSLNQAKAYEQQTFVIRGKITAYEEQIGELMKRHGVKEEEL